MRGPKGCPTCPVQQEALVLGANLHVQADGDEAASPTCWMESGSKELRLQTETQSSCEPKAATDVVETEEEEEVLSEAEMVPEVSRDDWEVNSRMRGIARSAETLDCAGHSMPA